MKQLFQFFFILPAAVVLAQGSIDRKIDSLQQLLAVAPADTQAVNLLNQLSRYTMNTGDYPEALELSGRAFRLSDSLGWDKGRATALNNTGVVYWYQGNFSQALHYYLEALKLRERLGDKKGISASYNNIALIYKNQRNFEDALRYNFSSLRIKKELNDREGIAFSYNNIGNIYQMLGKYDTALKYQFMSLELRKTLNDKKNMASCYNNIGNLYNDLGNYPEALRYHYAALALREEAQDLEGIGASYMNIGSVLNLQGKYREARDYLEKALTISVSIGDKVGAANVYFNLHRVSSSEGDYRRAFLNYKMHILYRDSLNNEEVTKQTVQAQMKYEFDKQQAADSIRNAEQLKQEALKHEQEITQQKIYTYGGVMGFVLMLVVAGISLKAFRDKQKANCVITEQKLLAEAKQREILDSIQYAKRIQQSQMPTEKYMTRALNRLLEKGK